MLSYYILSDHLAREESSSPMTFSNFPQNTGIKYPTRSNSSNNRFSFYLNSIFLQRQNSELMLELIKSVRGRKCPNYWIPDINLFEDFVEIADTEGGGKKLDHIVDLLEVIIEAGKNAVIDQWLECSRYLMENCCFYECCSRIEGDEDLYHIEGDDVDLAFKYARHNSKPEEEKYVVDEKKHLAKIISNKPTWKMSPEKVGFCCGANCREWHHEFDHY